MKAEYGVMKIGDGNFVPHVLHRMVMLSVFAFGLIMVAPFTRPVAPGSPLLADVANLGRCRRRGRQDGRGFPTDFKVRKECGSMNGDDAQTEFCAEYTHNGSAWGLNFFAVDQEDAALKIESIRESLRMLGQLMGRGATLAEAMGEARAVGVTH